VHVFSMHNMTVDYSNRLIFCVVVFVAPSEIWRSRGENLTVLMAIFLRFELGI